MKKYILLLVFTVLGTSYAQAECFRPERSEPRFRVTGPSEVLIQGAFNKVYQLQLGSCWELGRPNTGVHFRWSLTCENDDLYVYDRYSGRIIDRCWILDINEYQPSKKPGKGQPKKPGNGGL